MVDHPYREAGRRPKAALISYQLGRAGVDRTLREVPENGSGANIWMGRSKVDGVVKTSRRVLHPRLQGQCGS
jgi:hypothetical protein